MRNYAVVLLLGICFFIPYLGDVHLFDWDEINFAECAREMLITGDYFRPQINYQPFFEKPPLFIWMQVLSMKLFGINEFAARFPNAVCGIFTLILIFSIGTKLYHTRLAWLWVFVWLASFLPHFYFKSGIIDPWFNLFIFSGLWCFFLGKSDDKHTLLTHKQYFVIAGLLCGAAILTKGPVALLVSSLVIGTWWLVGRASDKSLWWQYLIFAASAVIFPGIWFATDIALHGWQFTNAFTAYQVRLLTEHDAGHGGFFGYHFVVFLLGCFVASAFATPWLFRLIPAWREPKLCDGRSIFSLWMWILFWAVMALFSLVQTKIVHYSSLIYFPATFFAAYAMWTAEKWNIVPKYSKHILGMVGVVVGALLFYLPFLGKNTALLARIFKDDAFALGNLEADVCWQWYHGVGGIFLLTGIAISLYEMHRKQMRKANDSLLLAGMLATSASINLLPANIEEYSQNAAIEFYKNKAHEHCTIETWQFKSYAHLFYANKRQMTEADTSRPVYIVCKTPKAAQLEAAMQVKKLYEKNGFSFYQKRDKSNPEVKPEPNITPMQNWNQLTPEEERIIVHKGTERPFTGEYNDFKASTGTFVCRRCNAPLYRASDKFDSHCGWPSFDDEIPGAVKRYADNSLGMRRVEIVCANCDGHLGHVFEGERLTAKNVRHCVNSLSIRYVPD